MGLVGHLMSDLSTSSLIKLYRFTTSSLSRYLWIACWLQPKTMERLCLFLYRVIQTRADRLQRLSTLGKKQATIQNKYFAGEISPTEINLYLTLAQKEEHIGTGFGSRLDQRLDNRSLWTVRGIQLAENVNCPAMMIKMQQQQQSKYFHSDLSTAC